MVRAVAAALVAVLAGAAPVGAGAAGPRPHPAAGYTARSVAPAATPLTCHNAGATGVDRPVDGGTPLANLHVTVLEKLEMRVDRLRDSTRRLDL